MVQIAWTSPITFTSGTTLTAAQLNTYLRDNLLELAPAKATTTSGYFVTTGTNAITERVPKVKKIATSQTTTSTSYVDLATVGPSVTVATGAYAFVFTSTKLENNTTSANAMASWAISGATTRSAFDTTAVELDGVTGANFSRLASIDLVTTLTPGSNTFTMKYKVSSGTGTFADRQLTVLPF